MTAHQRSEAAENARTVIGWLLLAVFLGMVTLWTVFGFDPRLIESAPEPLASFGRVQEWWPILAGALAGAGAAWAWAPGLRASSRGAEGGGGGVSLRPWAAAERS